MAEGSSENRDIEALRKDIAALREAVSTLADDMGAYARGEAESIREDVQGLAKEATRRGRDSAAAVESTIKEHPAQSILLAFGLGLLTALLLRRQ